MWICIQGDWLCRRSLLANQSLTIEVEDPSSVIRLPAIRGLMMAQRTYTFSKNIVRCAIAPCMAIFFFTFVPSSGSWAKDICSNVPDLPAKIGELRLVWKESFEDRKLGFGAGYERQDDTYESLSIYRYDLGLSDTDNALAKNQLRQAINHVLQKGIKLGEPNSLLKEQVFGAIVPILGFPAEYGSNSGFEYVGVGHNGKCLVKIRYTNNLSEPSAAHHLLQNHLAQMRESSIRD